MNRRKLATSADVGISCVARILNIDTQNSTQEYKTHICRSLGEIQDFSQHRRLHNIFRPNYIILDVNQDVVKVFRNTDLHVHEYVWFR